MTRPAYTLLVVEDSPEDRGTYKAFLAEDPEWEYRFLEEEEAEPALELCRTQVVDCVLLDYHLPGMDGLEFLQRLRELRGVPRPPVVLLTGRGSEQLATRALKSGAADYLVKSDVTPERLFRAVRNTLERELLRRQVEAQEEERHQRADFERYLAGIVGHDLRNPISTISLSASMLLRRDGLDERQRDVVNRILGAAERAQRLIDTTLDFTQARLGGGLRMVRKPLDLKQLARQVVEELLLNFPDRRLELTAEGPGQGEWDGDRLAQVIINLVTNALKYSPDGTPVEVRLRGEGQAIILEVHNRGAPISPELLPRLFTPMKRGEANSGAGRSLGLGLFIVDHIVRAHGGTIDVVSDAARGTTFTVRLPRHPAVQTTS